MMTMRRWLEGTLIATVLAALATLSVRGRDIDYKFVRNQTCEDVNQDLSGPQWSPSNCIEGHECVVCEVTDFGQVADGTGSGPTLMGPQPRACGGDRIIGVCTATGSNPSYCDLSNSYQDGDCGGAVYRYTQQQPPIDP